jgi:murein DD-endopeptidase MepM/ murein hydrolase activator NlpD
VVTSEVGWRKDPFSGELKYHKGTDIAAAAGTSIRAVASGVVVESGPKGEYGNAVVIRTDDGRRMLYGHNSENFVRVGDRVEQGSSIAAVGATGRATGPHVHFEVMD